MADIETSVVISAQIDGLRSGMEAAANSVQTATHAMRTQLAGLGDIAQQVQSQLTAATGQIGTGIGALQSRTSDLAGSIGAGMMPSSGPGDAGASGPVRTGAPPCSAASKTPASTKSSGTKSYRSTKNSKATRRNSIFKRCRPAKEPGKA